MSAKLILAFYLFIVLCSCGRTDENYVPSVAVNVTIYPSNPEYFRLSSVGGWAYVNGGVRGIIVYRKSINEFVAMDRNCSYRPTDNCATVNVDSSSNIYAVCQCCSSSFVLTDGSVSKSPATQPLRQYMTNWDGNALNISN